MAMGKLLYEVKGSTQGQGISKSEVQAAADAILQPLMDLLDGDFLVQSDATKNELIKDFDSKSQCAQNFFRQFL